MLPISLAHFGLLIEILAVAVLALWVAWHFFGAKITAAWPKSAPVTTAVDVSEQMAAYAALTAIRQVPDVAADPQAVTAWKPSK